MKPAYRYCKDQNRSANIDPFSTVIYTWKRDKTSGANAFNCQEKSEKSDSWWYSDAYTSESKYDKWYETYLSKNSSADQSPSVKKRSIFTKPGQAEYTKSVNVHEPYEQNGGDECNLEFSALAMNEENKKWKKIAEDSEHKEPNLLCQDSFHYVGSLASNILDEALESMLDFKHDGEIEDQDYPPPPACRLTVLETVFKMPIDLEAYKCGIRSKNNETKGIPFSRPVETINKKCSAPMPSRIPRLIVNKIHTLS